MAATWQPLAADQDDWVWLHDATDGSPAWGHINRPARLAMAPSAATLASVLREFPLSDYPRQAPWPFQACIRHATGQADPAATLEELAEAAVRGELGDLHHWLEAEARWDEVIPVDADFLERAHIGPYPLSPDLSKSGYPASGFNYIASGLADSDAVKNIYGLVGLLLKHSGADSIFVLLAMFLASLIARKGKREPRESETSELKLRTLLGPYAIDFRGPTYWIEWLDSEDISDSEPSEELLCFVGTQPRLVGDLGSKGAKKLLERSQASVSGWPLVRLAVFAAPVLVEEIDQDWFQSLVNPTNLAPLGALPAAVAIFSSNPTALWTGSLDGRFREIAANSASTLGSSWFSSLLDASNEPRVIGIAARGALVVADEFPQIAEVWLEAALKHHRDHRSRANGPI